MTNENLKQCPFCGHAAEYERKEEQGRRYIRVSCCNCAVSTMWYSCTGRVKDFPGKYKPIFPDAYTEPDGQRTAAAVWNARVP